MSCDAQSGIEDLGERVLDAELRGVCLGLFSVVDTGFWTEEVRGEAAFVPEGWTIPVISTYDVGNFSHFAIWGRLLRGGNLGNAVTFKHSKTDHIWNFEYVKRLAGPNFYGDCSFAFCVKWTALAFPGDYVQRIANTFGPHVWALARRRYFELCLALLPLDLPVYVLMWILDYFKEIYVAPEIEKVRLGERLQQSRARVVSRRKTNKALKLQ